MNHDAPSMQQQYPDPNSNAAENSAGPFYGSPTTQPRNDTASQEEILAAQLSRTLAPNMSMGGSSENHDPRAQPHLAQYHPDHMHGRMPSPQMNQGQMDMSGQFESADGSDTKKRRVKVSRACDECRRKKVKCDAKDEGQCSNCKRVGANCQFSRQPMKRGPSKGYIKELEVRINHLEGAIIPPFPQSQDGVLQRRPSEEEFSPTPNSENMSRKRGFSAMSGAGEFNSPYAPPRSAPNWPPPNQQPHPQNQIATNNLNHPNHAAQQATPAPIAREPDHSPGNMAIQQQWPMGPAQTNPLDLIAHLAQPQNENPTAWDENIIDSYYKYIHPTYPFLSHSKARLNSRLAACPAPVRDAFLEALYAAIRSFPNSPPLEPRNTQQAINLMTTALFDIPTVRPPSLNLVYLQTMMLLAIEAGNRPCDLSRGNDFPTTLSPWMSYAVGYAYSMQMHVYKKADASNNDPDSDGKLVRRVWWSLIIMDRWQAALTNCPPLILDTVTQIYPDDREILGLHFYYMARLSVTIKNLAQANLVPDAVEPHYLDLPRKNYKPILKDFLDSWRCEFQGGFPDQPEDAPIINMCYWFMFILVRLPLPPLEIDEEDMGRAMYHIITQSYIHPDLRCPLLHHMKYFVALAATSLLKADEVKPSVKLNSEEAITMLTRGILAPSPWDAQIRELLANRVVEAPVASSSAAAPALVAPAPQAAPIKQDENQHIASQGLQQLADLATANDREVTASTSGVSGGAVATLPASDSTVNSAAAIASAAIAAANNNNNKNAEGAADQANA